MASSRMQTTNSERRRQVNIAVLDKNGNPARGAKISFQFNGTPCGRANLSGGKVSVEVPDTDEVLTAVAELSGETQSLDFARGHNEGVIQFLTSSGLTTILPNGTAICPDNTSGQPCVDCRVGGVLIRICA